MLPPIYFPAQVTTRHGFSKWILCTAQNFITIFIPSTLYLIIISSSRNFTLSPSQMIQNWGTGLTRAAIQPHGIDQLTLLKKNFFYQKLKFHTPSPPPSHKIPEPFSFHHYKTHLYFVALTPLSYRRKSNPERRGRQLTRHIVDLHVVQNCVTEAACWRVLWRFASRYSLAQAEDATHFGTVLSLPRTGNTQRSLVEETECTSYDYTTGITQTVASIPNLRSHPS